ncbi:Thiamine-monophosphate kinase [uncultured Desulfobacterium sp.]|uniref:Thiamine-monophosphate kinase n=1 Tax=uncultured Desulfobacterium sp. TaxID=201089 RepID=A0A445MYQ8_9BACT|nr:Thiamine-monophosphate kinase [uncultured Desulfobacterium sp.]
MKDIRMKMEDIGEFGFIRSIENNCILSPARIIKGIGDDCAVVGPYDGRLLLITTDMLVEDIHFILGKIPPEHLGEKAVNVSLSDIAAMGGEALNVFVSLAIPKQIDVDIIHTIYSGIKSVCRANNLNILGGDTSASPDRLIISITVIGEAAEGKVLLRSGANPGDGLYLTGTIGDSAAGLKLIKAEATAPEPIASRLIEAHNRPVHFLDAGRIVGSSGLASSMIDLSDGLLSDLAHICEQSHVGARIFQAALPVSRELIYMAESNRLDPYELAMSGGEDYRLLISVPARNKAKFQEIFDENAPCPVYCIGEITSGQGIELIRADNTREQVRVTGFDHFKR